MYNIVNAKDFPGGVDQATRYIHSKWGSKTNLPFYADAIDHSYSKDNRLPKFFVMTHHDRIVGCYALITNDFISRHDLLPWFACLYIEKAERGKKLSQRLFDHARQQAANAGFDFIYLTTDHENLYERFGWQRLEDGYEPSGEATRIYRLATRSK